MLCIARLFGEDPTSSTSPGQGVLAAPTPAQPRQATGACKDSRAASPGAHGTRPSPVATSVHGLVVSHRGEGDAIGALLAPLALLAPDQQRAGTLAVHQALSAVLLVALQHPAARVQI